MSELIEPRTLRGFRDFPPALMIPRERLLETVRRVYRSYGFLPMDTPALEYAEILLGKGGEESDRLVYRFRDHGDRDVALRFDLTVPFARFAAQYAGQLGTPFKRYQVGPVWRGENTAQGRFREFWQCDFDTIGTTSNAADAEAVLVAHDLLAALGFERFRVRVNNRLLLNGLLQQLGMAERAVPVLRALDKLGKADHDAVRAEMVEKAGVGAADADRVLALAETSGDNAEVLARLERDFGDNATAAEGVARLREILDLVAAAGVPEGRVTIDVSIARGLDYYTGTVFEAFLADLPGIGSVCSGGRYDNLAGLYTKQQLPGIGGSLGLDRLLAAMEKLGVLPAAASPAPVLVVQFAREYLGAYEKAARRLREAGVGAEVYPDAKRVGQQLQYAERRGFRVAVIGGPDEVARGEWKVKDLAKRQEAAHADADLVAAVRRLVE